MATNCAAEAGEGAGAAFLWTDEVSKSNATNRALLLRLGPCRSMSNMASPFRLGDDLAIDQAGLAGRSLNSLTPAGLRRAISR